MEEAVENVDVAAPNEVQSAVISEPALAEVKESSAPKWYEGDAVSGVELTDKDKEFSTIEDYVKHTHSLREMIGKKGVVPPGPDATAEEKAAFRESLGEEYAPREIPSPDAYDVEALASNEALTDERRSDIFGKFNGLELTNEQANGVMELFGEQAALDAEMISEYNAETRKQSEADLKTEWGPDFKDRLAAVDNVAEKHSELLEKLEKVGLAGDKSVIDLFDQLARGTSEDQIAAASEVSTASAKDALTEYMASKEWKDVTGAMSGMSAGHPRYDAAVAKRDRMIEAAYK